MNKVFGIGLSRTGTKALAVAMTSLGIDTVHYHKATSKLLYNGIFKLPVLEEYDAIADAQTIPFYPQLDKEYPGSKFILTVRDIDEWLKSTKKHFRGVEREDRSLKEIQYSEAHLLRAAVYGTLVWDRDVFTQRYYAHRAAVMDYFKDRDDLLVLDICAGEGFEKLCPFLGVPVPDHRFPDDITAERLVKRKWRKQQKEQRGES
jgi:hypothetical protein